MKLAATSLANFHVRLEPFAEAHRAGLCAAARADPEIFRHMPVALARGSYARWFEQILQEQQAGRWIAHAVFAPPLAGELSVAQRLTEGADAAPPSVACGDSSPASGGAKPMMIVGQSCYLNIRPPDAGVEIGSRSAGFQPAGVAFAGWKPAVPRR